MQESLIYNLLKKLPYPFIVRHNRMEVYQEKPQIDFIELYRRCVYSAIGGYIVGRFFKKPYLFAALCPVPFILKFLYDEYNIMKQGKFQELFKFQNWQIKKKINEIQKKEKQQKVFQQKNTQIQTNIQLKKSFQGQKIVSVKQFVNKLPKEYY